MKWHVKKVLWITSCLVVTVLIVGVAGVQASGPICPVKISDDGFCKVYNAATPDPQRITALSSNTSPPFARQIHIVETPSAPNEDPPTAARENINATCMGQVPRDPKGAAIVYNFENTGCPCNIKEGGDSHLTEKWSQTLGPEGQFKLSCHFSELEDGVD